MSREQTYVDTPDGRLFPYIYLEPHQVSLALQAAAKRAQAAASADLGIDPPKVRYFRSAEADEWPDVAQQTPVYGACDPEKYEIYIWNGLEADEARQVVAHEVRHLAGGDEDDALFYGALF